MRYISMLNPFSIYYLWQNKIGKEYITKLINSIINENGDYKLLNFFNLEHNHVRSYCIFESNNNIILLDFNLNKRNIEDDMGILNYLEVTSNKNIFLIMLNDYKGNNIAANNIYNIFKNDSFIFADNILKQYKIDKKLSEILYKMPDELYQYYLHEENLLLNY